MACLLFQFAFDAFSVPLSRQVSASNDTKLAALNPHAWLNCVHVYNSHYARNLPSELQALCQMYMRTPR